MSRVRGYADWQPRAQSLELLTNVKSVLVENADYLPMTLRQVFYQLVVRGQIDKTEKGYKRLCEICNRARRAHLVNFKDIRDDGATVRDGHDFVDESDLRDYLRNVRQTARMDLQSYQDSRLYIWCEAAGMVPQLCSVAKPYGVSVISSGGFDSLTMKHDMANDLACGSIVLHLGDYDPSGIHVFKSLAEDVQGFGANVSFIRLAVTPEQIDQLSLPTAPPKKTDNRQFDDYRTVQCEAIPPRELARIVETAILQNTDTERHQQALEWQAEVRAA